MAWTKAVIRFRAKPESREHTKGLLFCLHRFYHGVHVAAGAG